MNTTKHSSLWLSLFATLSIGLGACADDLRDDNEGAGTGPDASSEVDDSDGGVEDTGRITHTDNGDGSTTTVVDASAHEEQVYMALPSGDETFPSGPEDSTEWDLAFNRFNITLNGGVSGTGGVEVVAITDTAFGDVTEPPAGQYFTDLEDGEDEDTDPDLFFDSAEGTWYDYNPETHVLTAKGTVYVLRAVTGAYYKLQFLDYYSEAGTSGHLTFQWAEIQAAANLQTLTVDASAQDAYVFLDLATGTTVSPATPETDLEWDLAIRRTSIRTNSGTSGAGTGGALEIEGAALATVGSAPAEGYVVDAMLPIPGPPGSGEESGNPTLASWFDYDFMTHVVSPRSTSYVIRHSDGDFSRVQITAYNDGMYDIDWSYAGAASSEF